MDFDAAMEMYQALYGRFLQEYGEQTIKRVYLSAMHSDQSISHRSERGPDGLLDWNTLRRDWSLDSKISNALWLVAGDDHASCRLYATSAGAGTGSTWLWRTSCFFAREQQTAPFEQSGTGIGVMEAASIGRQAALEDTGMTEAQIARVAYLVGHHHTLRNIHGPDYQILIEADYIANASENGYGKQSVMHFMDTVMKTASGKHLAASVLGISASNLGCAGR